MGIRYRRSIQIAPAVRLSPGWTDAGLPVGVPGARYSAPGRAADGEPAMLIPSAGWLARPAQKQYREALIALLTRNTQAAAALFELVLAEDPKAISAHLLAALAIDDDAETGRAIGHLEAVVTADRPVDDGYLRTFVPAASAGIGINARLTEVVAVRVPLGGAGAALLLAEEYRKTGRLDEAIGVVQQLGEANPSDRVIRVALADLLFADGDYDGVLELTDRSSNEDDLSVALLHLRAAAFVVLGYVDNAFDTFKLALAYPVGRDERLLLTVRYDRALAYLQAGQWAKARMDLQRIHALDPDFADVRERLGLADGSGPGAGP